VRVGLSVSIIYPIYMSSAAVIPWSRLLEGILQKRFPYLSFVITDESNEVVMRWWCKTDKAESCVMPSFRNPIINILTLQQKMSVRCTQPVLLLVKQGKEVPAMTTKTALNYFLPLNLQDYEHVILTDGQNFWPETVKKAFLSYGKEGLRVFDLTRTRSLERYSDDTIYDIWNGFAYVAKEQIPLRTPEEKSMYHNMLDLSVYD